VKVVFMGFRGWGLPALEAASEDHDVTTIITHPEDVEPFNMAFSESVQAFGASHGICTFVSKNAQQQSIRAAVEGSKPDIILSSNWRRRIASDLLKLARFGGINVHRSLLPKYAGFAPINWAIAKGESVTGVTLHTMADGIDAGDIIVQESLEIGADDTATTVYHKMIPIVRRLVKLGLARIESGTATFQPQDPSRIEYFSKRIEHDLRIDWHHSRARVCNLVRAQSAPFPSAITSWNAKRVYVERARFIDRCFRGTPGRIVEIGSEGIVVLCGESDGPEGQGLVLTSVRFDDSASTNPSEIIRSTTECFV
jgi:methionyl-tRNA formyltransferase